MSRWIFLTYPLLFAAARVLWVAAGNPGQYRAADLLTVVAALLLAVGLTLVVTTLVLRWWSPPERAEQRAAAFTMLAVALVFYCPSVYRGLRSVGWPFPGGISFPVFAVLVSAAAAVLIVRRPGILPAAGRALTVCAALVVGVQALRVTANHVRASRTIADSALVRALGAPIPTTAVPPGRNDPRRDIYLIVLDARANSAVLRERFGMDDSAFEDSLRALGFTIPRDMRSNYMQTVLSIPSLVNFEHITRLAEDAGRESRDYALPRYLVAHNRAARFLKQQGYEYVSFPSAWLSLTDHSPLADREYQGRAGFDLRDELRRTELRRALVGSSLLHKVAESEAGVSGERSHYLRTFAGLAELPADAAPTFAFAHFLLPHGPFLVDAACDPVAHPILAGGAADVPEDRAAYVDQVRCANKLVLALVTTVLRRSPTPPIILVVGDHGTRTSSTHFLSRPDKSSADFVRERFGAFGAFYVPAGGDSLFAGRVTLVNVLRIVLRYYFGAELPPVPDEQFLSGVQPYKFYRVDTLAAAWAREGPTRPGPVSIDGATSAGVRSGRTGRVPP